MSAGEWIVVLILFLILLGPQKLPHLARALLKIFHEMKHILARLEKEWNLKTPKKPPPDHAP